MLEPCTPRTCYLPRNSQYRGDSAVANANGVLVRLICDEDDGPTLKQHWVDVSCLLGMYIGMHGCAVILHSNT